jgi:hypothetical protein
LGIAVGIVVSRLEAAESWRGNLAAWLLLLFGVGYGLWGLWRGRRAAHGHHHHHHGVDIAPVADSSSPATRSTDDASLPKFDRAPANQAVSPRMTPWVLFTIFVFGPCEPLIPLLMYPAAQASLWSVVWVTALFGITTLATMLILVTTIRAGLVAVHWPLVERYNHAIAGLVLALCGLTMVLGL